ncbi:MAG: DUF2200 domain-containing protein [Lachnospirales bacterium]
MEKHKIFQMSFASIYDMYIQKAERKERTKIEVDEIICWLTGYDLETLHSQIDKKINLEDFLIEAPSPNPKRELIKGVVCGIRVENMENSLMKEVRLMDKLIDELAKGKKMEKILRA